MPEGPEIFQASHFINTQCKETIFGGSVTKSKVSRSPNVDWDVPSYSITASSWGKELKLTLTEVVSGTKAEPKSLAIVFGFGLVGRISFVPVEEIHKSAHLNFFTKDKKKILSFVDPMRFGSWNLSGQWAKDRGPCVINDYTNFRSNVLNNLDKAPFNKPICEVLANQKYFNGIGNYLRSEILYRAGVRPFDCARDVLEILGSESDSDHPDLLELCHKLPVEVVNLSEKSGYGAAGDTDEASAYVQWLQCYNKPDSNNMVDSNKRTIWYRGDPGSMAPKNATQRHTKGVQSKRTSKVAFAVSKNDTESPQEERVTNRAVKRQVEEETTTKSTRRGRGSKRSSLTVDDAPEPKRPKRGQKLATEEEMDTATTEDITTTVRKQNRTTAKGKGGPKRATRRKRAK